jgi:hypothetical protein
MSRRSERKKILQELGGMLATKVFAHVLKDGTNINNEVEGLEVQISIHHVTTLVKVIQVMMGSLVFICYTWTFETQKYLWDKIQVLRS